MSVRKRDLKRFQVCLTQAVTRQIAVPRVLARASGKTDHSFMHKEDRSMTKWIGIAGFGTAIGLPVWVVALSLAAVFAAGFATGNAAAVCE